MEYQKDKWIAIILFVISLVFFTIFLYCVKDISPGNPPSFLKYAIGFLSGLIAICTHFINIFYFLSWIANR